LPLLSAFQGIFGSAFKKEKPGGRNLEPGQETPDLVVASSQGGKTSFLFPVDDDPDLGLNSSLIIGFPQLLVEKTGSDPSCGIQITIRAVVKLHDFQNPPHNLDPFGPQSSKTPFKGGEAIEAKRHRVRASLF